MTVELSARYVVADDEQHAALMLEGDLSLGLEDDPEIDERPDVFLTVIHERLPRPLATYDLRAFFQLRLEVDHGHSLTLIARREGKIIASLVSEADTLATSRLLLRPKGGFNILIHQQRCYEPEEIAEATTTATTARGFLIPLGAPPPSPATLALADLLRAADAYYADVPGGFPLVIHLLLPVVEEALRFGDEAISRQALAHLCSVLEELDIHRHAAIASAYDAARAVSYRP